MIWYHLFLFCFEAGKVLTMSTCGCQKFSKEVEDKGHQGGPFS